MTLNNYVLEEHLRGLSVAYSVSVSDDNRWIIVRNFKTPPGFNQYYIDILIRVPKDYPVSPPGTGSRVYIPSGLRFKGKKLADVYPDVNPGWGSWAWFCYQNIKWDPTRDDLVKFMEMVRLDLTNSKTK
jgi:hypothetical protein